MTLTLNTAADSARLHVTVSGELDVVSASGLRGAVARRANGGAAVQLDLEGVTFIDCTGISALLACQQEVSAAGGTLRLGSLSAAVARMIDLTGVGSRFTSLAATA